MANWSELPFDLLRHLTGFLPIQDYHRFGAVCRNWDFVAKEKCHSPARQIPWLVLGQEKDPNKRKFYNILEAQHYNLHVPELRGKYICGSKNGWLFTLDRKLNFNLVNPLTRQCFDLPSPPPYAEDYDFFNGQDVAPYLEAESDEEEAHGSIRKEFDSLQIASVLKATFDYDPGKRPDFTVLILYGEVQTPSFWRPGSVGWTNINGLPPRFLDDIAFHNGKFYAVTNVNAKKGYVIYAIDVGLEPKITQVGPRVPLHGDPNFVFEDRFVCSAVGYIVELDGELLLVERFFKTLKDYTPTIEFVVHKLDLEGERYTTCQHIDGHTIFLGGSCSPVVSKPDQFIQCKKDAIYFTDFESGYSEVCGCEELGIYDLVGKNITPYYPRDVFHLLIANPTWFTPSPW